MEKRKRRRFARRLQISYWVKGEDHARQGYTANISAIGAFIATNEPLQPGTRLRVEFLVEGSFFVEAVVMHAARVSASLQSIRSSGMGIRFLTISELVSGLLQMGHEAGAEDDTDMAHEAAHGEGLAQSEPGGAEASRAPGQQTTYTVDFRNVAYLLDAIEKEITFGGVFVATDSPAELHRDVRIALALPAPIRRTVHAEARVVSVSGATPSSDESTVSGMGVAFRDSTKVLEELNRLIERARPKRMD